MTSDRTRLRAFLALCLARLREYYREPEVLFWGFVFPLLLSGALAVAFRDRPPSPSRAVVLQRPGAERVLAALGQAPLAAGRAGGRRRGGGGAAHGPRRHRRGAAGRPRRRRSTTGWTPRGPEADVARARVDDALQRAAGRKDVVTQPRRGGERARRALRGLPGARADRHEPDERRDVGRRLRARRHAHQEAAAAAAGDPDAGLRLHGGADGDARRVHASSRWGSCWPSVAWRSASPCGGRSRR